MHIAYLFFLEVGAVERLQPSCAMDCWLLA